MTMASGKQESWEIDVTEPLEEVMAEYRAVNDRWDLVSSDGTGFSRVMDNGGITWCGLHFRAEDYKFGTRLLLSSGSAKILGEVR